MAKLRIKKSTHALNRSLAGDMGVGGILFVFGVFMAFPMVYTVVQSLKPLNELWMFPPRFYVVNPTLKNFTDLFYLMSTSWVPFSRYIFNTVFISVCGTFGNVMLSSFAAYSLAKIKFPGRKTLFTIIVYSLMFNSTVTSITNFMTMSMLGWVDTYLSIIVPAIASPMGLYLMKQFMDTSVPDSVLESARLDGASEWHILWTLVMPMVKPAWMTLIIFAFQGLWNQGASVFIFSEELKTFPYAISQIMTGGIARAGASAASAVLTMIVPIVVFVASQSQVLQTMSSSGMKD